jgi:predicted NBD/HSP70 family sugar kinase
VSEGVGVGLLLNGQLVHGANSMAGEFGHVSLADDGPACRCGRRGCWERYASNSAALQYYAAIGGASPSPRFEDLPRLAERGDVRAAETLDRMARYLGVGLSNLAVGLDPDVIVIVGEVTTAWARIGPIVEDILRTRALAPPMTRLVPTDSAAQPRLRGAVTLVVQQHFGAPAVA